MESADENLIQKPDKQTQTKEHKLVDDHIVLEAFKKKYTDLGIGLSEEESVSAVIQAIHRDLLFLRKEKETVCTVCLVPDVNLDCETTIDFLHQFLILYVETLSMK